MNKQSLSSYKLVLQIPQATGDPQEFSPPPGIPKELAGDLKTSGRPLIQTGYNLLFMTATVIAVIIILYSGIQMITSGGDSTKLMVARKRLLYAIIGVVIISLAFMIVSAAIKLVGSNPQDLFRIRTP